ncbi:hypothetical protein B0H34DRAFT_797292 [Crassisporium funariophilum]|nr:hypothetical protein B0H34DRAFT_797292 [Crassisporium funariophilum]
MESSTLWTSSLPDASTYVAVPRSGEATTYVHLDPGWTHIPKLAAHSTNTFGSKAVVEFSGSSITWIGMKKNEIFPNMTSASYSVDGGAPVAFTVAGLPANATSVTNLTMFTTPKLPLGKHTLIVLYEGNAISAPMYLVRLEVHLHDSSGTTWQHPPTYSSMSDASFLETISSTSVHHSRSEFSSLQCSTAQLSSTVGISLASHSWDSSTSTRAINPSSNRNTITPAPARVIAGVVAGTLALLGVIFVISVFLRKRRSRNFRETLITPYIHSYHSEIENPRERLLQTPLLFLPNSYQGIPRGHPYPRPPYTMQTTTGNFGRPTGHSNQISNRRKLQREHASSLAARRQAAVTPPSSESTSGFPLMMTDRGGWFEVGELPPAYTPL